MLFFLNLDGTVTRSDTDHVYQGQNKVANVELFTLISPAQAAIQVAFTLPNGLTTAYLPVSYVGAYSVDENNQKQVHRWKLAVPYNVTEVEGQVGVSFNVLLNDGTSGQTQETINQTTYTSSFTVEYSALPIPPTTVNNDEIQQILDLLDKYYAQNASLAAKQPFVVGTVKTNTLDADQQASVAVEQSTTPDSKGNYPTNFTFGIPQGIQGTQGEVGETPDVSAVAEINNTVGTPSVEVEKSGTKENPVFNFKFSNVKGPKGDSGIGDAKLSNTPGASETDGYTQNAVNGIVQNPNLLINPNFAINQRGQTSYNATDNHIYTVDRIKLFRYTTPTLTPKANGGIKISGNDTGTGSQFILGYFLEDFAELAGKTVTLSLKVSNVTGGGLRVRVGNSYLLNITEAGLFTVTFVVSASPTDLSIILTTLTNGSYSFDLDYWKLEIGSIATEFSPPSIAEELPKCQRYYQKIALHGSGMTASQQTRIYPIISLPVTMRVKPTMTVITNPDIRGNGKNYVLTDNDSILADNIFDNGVRILVLTATDQFTPNQVYCLANGVATLDAEL